MAFASGREGADRPARIGWHVAQARERTGISLGEAAAAAGMSIAELEALEAGWRPPGDGELERLAQSYGMPVDELLPPRTPILIDPDAGTLGIGSRRAPLSETREDALSAYLDMIYEARGVPRGEKIPLRDEDLDVLAGLVGDDPDEVEAQLVELMDYTPEEARRVRALLFRRKILAGAAGVVLGLGAAGMMLGQSRAPGTPVAMEDAAAGQSSDPAAGFTPWGAPAGPPVAAPSDELSGTTPVPDDPGAGDPGAPADETPAPVTSAPRGIDIGTPLVIVAPAVDDDVTGDVGDPPPPLTEEPPTDVPGDPAVDTGGNDNPGGSGNDNPGGGSNDTPGNDNPGGGNDTPDGGNGNDNPGGGGGNDTPGNDNPGGNDNPDGGGENDTPGNDNPGGGNDTPDGGNGNDNPGGNGNGNPGGSGNQDGNTNGQGWGVGGTPPAGQQPAGGPHSS